MSQWYLTFVSIDKFQSNCAPFDSQSYKRSVPIFKFPQLMRIELKIHTFKDFKSVSENTTHDLMNSHKSLLFNICVGFASSKHPFRTDESGVGSPLFALTTLRDETVF